MNSGRFARAYTVQQDPDTRAAAPGYTFTLETRDNNNTVQHAVPPANFTNRALLEAHIRETMHILQGRPAEGMHLVEHILLRPQPDAVQALAPVAFSGGGQEPFILEPYACQVSIFLPGWAPRFQDPEFRVVVERVLRSELPAHIFPYIYWVNLNEQQQIPAEFIAFETAWRNWLEHRTAGNRNVLVDAVNVLVASEHAVQPAYRYQPFDIQP
ncbi:MAG: hypothetical protein IPM98_13015 [Lewinellaceae bacterium]|nr:hypothetical protein [Lewinellaceae bacterium]